VDWGGGIKSIEDLQIVFSCGARQATVGSIAAENADLFHIWLSKFGSEKLILGADLKEGKIATRGWQETSDLDWREFFKLHVEQGVQTIISTDIAKDGMLSGPATGLYIQMLEEFPAIDLIASGGISSIDDLSELKRIGCAGAIVGKAIYENKISLTQLQEFI
jgi:phosphoribosylformimino-5-aminoimidazole carboxamide ribotide isomerase